MARADPVRLYVACDDETLRLAVDDALVAIDPAWVALEEVARPQHADVILVIGADREALCAELRRAGADAAMIWGEDGAGGDIVAAWDRGFDERLGLAEAAPQWARVLRALGAARRERRRAAAIGATYRDAVHGGSTGRWQWDLTTGVIRLDPAWKAMLGYVDDEVQDDTASWFERVAPSDRGKLRAALDELIHRQGKRLQLEHRIQHRDRSYVWVRTSGELRSDAHGLRIEGQQVEITAEKLAQLRLAYADRHDRLTGALSRAAFLEGLQVRLGEAPEALALMAIDIDQLKLLNRRWGRRAGDEVLLHLVGTLEDRFGVGGLFGRVSGDKFVCVLEGDDLVAFAALAADLRDELGREVFVTKDGDEFRASATFAVAMRPSGLDDAPELLRVVDRAVERARDAGEGVLLVTKDEIADARAATLRTAR